MKHSRNIQLLLLSIIFATMILGFGSYVLADTNGAGVEGICIYSDIYMSNVRGSNRIDWEMNLFIINNTSPYMAKGTWEVYLYSLASLPESNIISVRDLTESNMIVCRGITPATVESYGTSTSSYAVQKSWDWNYIMNTSYGTLGAMWNISNPNSEGVLSSGFVSNYDYGQQIFGAVYQSGQSISSYLYYNLKPTIILNSEFYNFHNTRCEVWDNSTCEWNEFSLSNIVLQHPTYKIRIYDSQTNNLIYEDNSFVNYSTYRTVSIDNIKLADHSKHLVNFTIQQHTENYLSCYYNETADSISMTNGTYNGNLLNLTENDNNIVEFTSEEYENYGAWESSYYEYSLKPTDNNYTGLTPISGSGENWERVDDWYDDATSYISGGTGAYDIYDLEDSLVETYYRLDEIGVRLRTYSSGGAHTYNLSINLGSGFGTQIGLTPPTTWQTTDNATFTYGGSYTIADFNNAQLKLLTIDGGTGNPSISSVDLTVKYTERDFNIGGKLNGYIQFNYTDINDDINDRENITAIDLDYRFYSNISQTVNIYAYDWTYSQWDILTSTSPITETAYNSTSLDYNYFKNDIDDLLFRFRIDGTNLTSGFESYFDVCSLNITYANISSLYYTYPQIFTALVSPYSYQLNNLSDSYNYTCYKYDIYGNLIGNENFSFSDYIEINYTSPLLRTSLISLSDQQGVYLPFSQYKMRINGTLIYEPYFYREVSDSVNISIYDRFNNYITSTIYEIQRDNNWIAIQLTLRSLKLYNQQSEFAWFNLTMFPITDYYWSEWLAPNEITEFKLIDGDYVINLTEYEGGTTTLFGYNLTSDDILLITSNNTISTIAGLGNQILTLDEYLTQLYQNVMFSELLNWTDIARNYTFIENYIDTWKFVNSYRDVSLEIEFRYNGSTDSFIIGAGDSLSRILPIGETKEVEFRMRNLETGERLSSWKPLPSNRTINLGFYEETIPATPDDIKPTKNSVWVVSLVVIIFMAIFTVVYIRLKAQISPAQKLTKQLFSSEKPKTQAKKKGRRGGIYNFKETMT